MSDHTSYTHKTLMSYSYDADYNNQNMMSEPLDNDNDSDDPDLFYMGKHNPFDSDGDNSFTSFSKRFDDDSMFAPLIDSDEENDAKNSNNHRDLSSSSDPVRRLSSSISHFKQLSNKNHMKIPNAKKFSASFSDLPSTSKTTAISRRAKLKPWERDQSAPLCVNTEDSLHNDFSECCLDNKDLMEPGHDSDNNSLTLEDVTEREAEEVFLQNGNYENSMEGNISLGEANELIEYDKGASFHDFNDFNRKSQQQFQYYKSNGLSDADSGLLINDDEKEMVASEKLAVSGNEGEGDEAEMKPLQLQSNIQEAVLEEEEEEDSDDSDCESEMSENYLKDSKDARGRILSEPTFVMSPEQKEMEERKRQIMMDMRKEGLLNEKQTFGSEEMSSTAQLSSLGSDGDERSSCQGSLDSRNSNKNKDNEFKSGRYPLQDNATNTVFSEDDEGHQSNVISREEQKEKLDDNIPTKDGGSNYSFNNLSDGEEDELSCNIISTEDEDEQLNNVTDSEDENEVKGRTAYLERSTDSGNQENHDVFGVAVPKTPERSDRKPSNHEVAVNIVSDESDDDDNVLEDDGEDIGFMPEFPNELMEDDNSSVGLSMSDDDSDDAFAAVDDYLNSIKDIRSSYMRSASMKKAAEIEEDANRSHDDNQVENKDKEQSHPEADSDQNEDVSSSCDEGDSVTPSFEDKSFEQKEGMAADIGDSNHHAFIRGTGKAPALEAEPNDIYSRGNVTEGGKPPIRQVYKSPSPIFSEDNESGIESSDAVVVDPMAKYVAEFGEKHNRKSQWSKKAEEMVFVPDESHSKSESSLLVGTVKSVRKNRSSFKTESKSSPITQAKEKAVLPKKISPSRAAKKSPRKSPPSLSQHFANTLHASPPSTKRTSVASKKHVSADGEDDAFSTFSINESIICSPLEIIERIAESDSESAGSDEDSDSSRLDVLDELSVANTADFSYFHDNVSPRKKESEKTVIQPKKEIEKPSQSPRPTVSSEKIVKAPAEDPEVQMKKAIAMAGLLKNWNQKTPAEKTRRKTTTTRQAEMEGDVSNVENNDNSVQKSGKSVGFSLSTDNVDRAGDKQKKKKSKRVKKKKLPEGMTYVKVKRKRLPTIHAKVVGGLALYENNESMAQLSKIETHRRMWFGSELAGLRREWEHYRKSLRDSVDEAEKVERLIRTSFFAFKEYGKSIDLICRDAFVSPDGHALNDKKREDLKKSGHKAAWLKSSELLNPIIQSFNKLKTELDHYVPLMEGSYNEAAELKEELIKRVELLESNGDEMGFDAFENAEREVKKAFDRLMMATGDFSTAGSMQNYDDDESRGKDRWLMEASYRNAARMQYVVWLKTRQQRQDLYSDIVRFDNERRDHLKQVLLSFLPRRRRLFLGAGDSLVPVTSVLKLSGLDKKEREDLESKAIEEALEQLSRSKLKDINNHKSSILNRSLSMHNDASGRSGGKSLQDDWSRDFNSAALNSDFSESAYVEDRRIFEVLLGSEWKLALGVLTRDHYLHIFTTEFITDESMFEMCDRVSAGAVLQVLKSPNPDFSVRLNYCEVRNGAEDAELTDLSQHGKDMMRLVKLIPKSENAGGFFSRRRENMHLTLRLKSDEEAILLANMITCITANSENEVLISSKHG